MTLTHGCTKLPSAILPPKVQCTSITPYLSVISGMEVFPNGTFIVSTNILMLSVRQQWQYGESADLMSAADHGKQMNPCVSYFLRTLMSSMVNALQNKGVGLIMATYWKVR